MLTSKLGGEGTGWLPLAQVAPEGSIKWPDGGPPRGDPYLYWAEATTSRVEPSHDGDLPSIGVLVELGRPDDIKWLLQKALDFIPDRVPHPAERRRYFTGVVNRSGLERLVGAVLPNGDGKVVRFTLQAARRDLSQAQLAAYRRARRRSADRPDAGDAEDSTVAAPNQVFVGLVDDALPFAQVVQSLQPRLTLWDEGWMPEYLRLGEDGLPAAPGNLPAPALGTEWVDPWTQPQGMLYGRILNPVRVVRPERLWYAAAAYVDPPLACSHGAAVLGRLAPWMSGRKAAAGEWPVHVAGVAMVQLPSLSVEDTSGGVDLSRHVLNAIDFVLGQEMSSRPVGAPVREVVVNVSYGVQQGPHDGSSMFETVAVELLQQYPHLHLVLPAGNSHRERCHSRRTLSRKGARFTLPVMVMPDSGRDTFIEVWLDADADVRIEILPPGHAVPLVAKKNQAQAWVTSVGGVKQVEFGVLYGPGVAQGNGLLALFAIAPTRYVGDATGIGLNGLQRTRLRASHGLWRLTIVNQAAAPCRFDAYVARGDAAPDSRRGSRQARFVDSQRAPAVGHSSTPTGTLSGIATAAHPRLHVIGAMREADGHLAEYSAAGPRRGDTLRDNGPDVVVKADRSLHLPGLPTAGFTAGARNAVDGTSIACAVHANALVRNLAGLGTPFEVPEIPPRREQGPRAPDKSRGKDRRVFYERDPHPPPW